MIITPFEELKVTTMTMVMSLSDKIKINPSFHLLPYTKVNLENVRETSKCKLPHHPVPGTILSMRYRGMTRGIIRTKSNPFKNAITIDISTKKKNISLKLASLSMQMCGASSREDGIEAAMHTIDHLCKIQTVLDKIQTNENPKLYLDWFLKNTEGASIIRRIFRERINSNKGIIVDIYDEVEDHRVIRDIDFPGHYDKEILDFLLSVSDEYEFHSLLREKIQKVFETPIIIRKIPKIVTVDEVMVNYNYSLGFEVDRAKLDYYIDGQFGFVSRYHNALTSSTTIELPYIPVTTSIKRRKNKVPHHTFLVYRSGSVTQSGPGGKLMEDAYYLFMEVISQLENYIKYDPNEVFLN